MCYTMLILAEGERRAEVCNEEVVMPCIHDPIFCSNDCCDVMYVIYSSMDELSACGRNVFPSSPHNTDIRLNLRSLFVS